MTVEKILVYDEAFCRLDFWLASQCPDVSRSALARFIREGRVSVNRDRVSKAGKKVKPGDLIEIRWPEETGQTPPAQSIPLQIVHEDDALLVVNKPPGMIVHPVSLFQRDTLVNALLGSGVSLADYGSPLRPGIVHRLDRDTSGVMVVAKTNQAYLSLVESFRRRQVEKWYLAVVEGQWRSRQTIDLPVGRNRRKPCSMSVRHTGGKQALTMITPLETGKDFSLISVRPATGRTHQIRVHLSALGFPIAGDAQYGATMPAGELRRQALHAFIVKLNHPATGLSMTFGAGLPQDMQQCLECLALTDHCF